MWFAISYGLQTHFSPSNLQEISLRSLEPKWLERGSEGKPALPGADWHYNGQLSSLSSHFLLTWCNHNKMVSTIPSALTGVIPHPTQRQQKPFTEPDKLILPWHGPDMVYLWGCLPELKVPSVVIAEKKSLTSFLTQLTVTSSSRSHTRVIWRWNKLNSSFLYPSPLPCNLQGPFSCHRPHLPLNNRILANKIQAKVLEVLTQQVCSPLFFLLYYT